MVQTKTMVVLQKVKLPCETRWVEHHTALEDFATMHEAVLDCLTAIASNRSLGWDSKAITAGNDLLNGFLSSITSPQFLAAFQINLSVFSCIKGLNKLLRGSSQDVILVYNEVETVKDALAGIRSNSEKEYKAIFENSEEMAATAGTEIQISKRCGRHARITNIPADTPAEYWKQSVFVPSSDELLQQLEVRFTALTAQALPELKAVTWLYRDTYR